MVILLLLYSIALLGIRKLLWSSLRKQKKAKPRQTPKRGAQRPARAERTPRRRCSAAAAAAQGTSTLLRRQLEYKSAWYGTELIVADRWFPSSKTCSGCGAVKADLTLADRIYECAACGLVIDRDLNAALNLARYTPPTDPEGTKTSPPLPAAA